MGNGSDTLFVHEGRFPGRMDCHPGPGFRLGWAICPVSVSLPFALIRAFGMEPLVLAWVADDSGRGLGGVCLQGLGLWVVGEGDLPGLQAADHIFLADWAGTSIPRPVRRLLCLTGGGSLVR